MNHENDEMHTDWAEIFASQVFRGMGMGLSFVLLIYDSAYTLCFCLSELSFTVRIFIFLLLILDAWVVLHIWVAD